MTGPDLAELLAALSHEVTAMLAIVDAVGSRNHAEFAVRLDRSGQPAVECVWTVATGTGLVLRATVEPVGLGLYRLEGGPFRSDEDEEPGVIAKRLWQTFRQMGVIGLSENEPDLGG